MPEAGDITVLLQQADEGNEDAANRLFLLVQPELEVIARKYKRTSAIGDEIATLEPVHEAFLRLVGSGSTNWQPGDRKKFYGYMAKRIHNLLIDLLRKESSAKRGGNFQRRDTEDLEGQIESRPVNTLELEIDLNQALNEYQGFDPDGASIFRLRHLTGCTFGEIADRLEMAETTVQRTHHRTKCWLKQKLKEYHVG